MLKIIKIRSLLKEEVLRMILLKSSIKLASLGTLRALEDLEVKSKVVKNHLLTAFTCKIVQELLTRTELN
jgi:hypothetical protein